MVSRVGLFGLPTDPSVLVQYINRSGGNERPIDVAEFADIPSPVKLSSNGYAYDGPSYNAGTLMFSANSNQENASTVCRF